MPDGIPQFDAAEVRIKFVPDTDAVDTFWEELERRRDEFVRETKEMFGVSDDAAFTPQAALGQDQLEIPGLDEDSQDIGLRSDVSQIKDKVESDILDLLSAILEAVQTGGIEVE